MSLNFENVGKEVIYNRSVDNIEDYVKGTIVGCYIGTDEEYYITSIESSGECIKISDDSLLEIIDSGGGGGSSVTPASIVAATGQMTSQQAATTRENLGAEPEKFVVTVFRGRHGWESDKTLTEITQAYESGKIIVVFSEDENLFYILSSHDSSEFLFVCVLHRLQSLSDPECMELRELKIDSSGWTESIIRAPLCETIVDFQSTTPTITPAANTIYNCNTLTSLTITDPPATGSYVIKFTSGATATTTTIPSTILGLESFAAEANTLYEINVLDNRAVVGSWKVSST